MTSSEMILAPAYRGRVRWPVLPLIESLHCTPESASGWGWWSRQGEFARWERPASLGERVSWLRELGQPLCNAEWLGPKRARRWGYREILTVRLAPPFPDYPSKGIAEAGLLWNDKGIYWWVGPADLALPRYRR
jgi:hypothetical protein